MSRRPIRDNHLSPPLDTVRGQPTANKSKCTGKMSLLQNRKKWGGAVQCDFRQTEPNSREALGEEKVPSLKVVPESLLANPKVSNEVSLVTSVGS